MCVNYASLMYLGHFDFKLPLFEKLMRSQFINKYEDQALLSTMDKVSSSIAFFKDEKG